MGRAFEYRRAAKEKRWDKMSKVFPKLGKAITVAAKTGGSDPFMNAKLRTAIANAKALNMPKDNIEAAIKRANSKDKNLIQITYEAKANYGVLLYIECMSDNPNRTVANLKSYLNKTPGSSLLVNGSLEFMFEQKSVFEFKADGLRDDLELELIDFGLEELEKLEKDDLFIAYADKKDFGKLSNKLYDLKIDILSAKLIRIPINFITLSEDQINEISKLIDKIEDDDDVLEVWSNIE